MVFNCLLYSSIKILQKDKKQEQNPNTVGFQKKKIELQALALPTLQQNYYFRNHLDIEVRCLRSRSSIFLGYLLCLCHNFIDSSNHIERLFWKVIKLAIQNSLLNKQYKAETHQNKNLGQRISSCSLRLTMNHKKKKKKKLLNKYIRPLRDFVYISRNVE